MHNEHVRDACLVVTIDWEREENEKEICGAATCKYEGVWWNEDKNCNY